MRARGELAIDSSNSETVDLFSFTCKSIGANSPSNFLSFVIRPYVLIHPAADGNHILIPFVVLHQWSQT